jgi:curved DNA-binding protein CbpA
MTYYEVLGVARDATAEQIKSAYRKKAAVMHPDRGGTVAGFQRLQEAHATLSDPGKREMYDLTLQAGDVARVGAKMAQRVLDTAAQEGEQLAVAAVRAGAAKLRRWIGL